MRVTSWCMCALAIVLFTTAASAAPFTNPLTPDQVACDELQLERLAGRLAVVEGLAGSGAVGLHPSLFLWRSSDGGGVYSALAVTDGVMGASGNLVRQETQLALDLVLHPVADPLNPARPLLPQGSLVRRELGSNLVTPTPLATYLTVTMALEPKAQNPFQPTIPLLVNNLTATSDGEQPAAHADAAGRGITQDTLTSSCESALTVFDQRIFTILSRTVRLAQCALLAGALPSCNPDGSVYNITLFRGTDPQTYRANVYFYAVACDNNVCSYGVLSKVAWEFKMNWDENGKLTSGEVSVLPPCPNGPAPGCSDRQGDGTPMFILPPLWPGHGHQGQHVFDLGALLRYDSPGSPKNIPSATVNWSVLLMNSAWN
jgi:hypothetical protein